MIVMDTNVVSEFMRDVPMLFDGDPWALNNVKHLVVTSVTRYEVLVGIRYLPDSKRKRELAARAATIMTGRYCLPFDSEAAEMCADVVAIRRAQGRPGEIEDCMIAAICLSRGLPLATRNVGHYTDLGLEIINPWEGTA